jgi:hypothetical protein
MKSAPECEPVHTSSTQSGVVLSQGDGRCGRCRAGTAFAFRKRNKGRHMSGLSAPRHCLEVCEEASSGSARARFLTAEDVDRLTQFYLGFDFAARRGRFGLEVSDGEIVGYCTGIEWRHSVLIAHAGAACLEALLEIHPLSQQWDCAELIAACPDRGDCSQSFAQLLQVAAFAAGQRGCRTFLVPWNDTSREILPLLQGMGRVRIATTQACVDLGGYAIPRERKDKAMWSPHIPLSSSAKADDPVFAGVNA